MYAYEIAYECTSCETLIATSPARSCCHACRCSWKLEGKPSLGVTLRTRAGWRPVQFVKRAASAAWLTTRCMRTERRRSSCGSSRRAWAKLPLMKSVAVVTRVRWLLPLDVDMVPSCASK